MDRAKLCHKAWNDACAEQQLLTPDQENSLVNWIKSYGEMGMPLSSEDLRTHTSAIAQQEVGKNWYRKLRQHHPELQAAKPAKLDPKRAKHFNETIINDYFDKLEALHAKYPGSIPPEHIWNMDEKGIQMGGGRKKSNKKFYYMKDQKQKYRICSDNLKLVTILECILAAGDVVSLSFCLQNGSTPDLRNKLDNSQFGR